ncbi:MAG: hypothetical protein VX777_02665 [Chlamydiota bacterium]|nr:hypothetical protein [Chlamydiota bacterium]
MPSQLETNFTTLKDTNECKSHYVVNNLKGTQYGGYFNDTYTIELEDDTYKISKLVSQQGTLT